jgi:2-polyprenyl-3-methyl-5-hydroxy-6-metoxy-1,4-benzoquinol methylase
LKCAFLLFPETKTRATRTTQQFACTNISFVDHGPIVKCAKCGIEYVDEEISQEKISSYYEIVEDPTYFAEQKAREKTFKNYLKKLEKIYLKKGKLLDIGTFTGLFVKIASDNGWNSTGLEPNRWGVEYGKKNYGVTIINKALRSDAVPKSSFDVITMWDVIEHFINPVSEMEKVFKFLKPGGIFVFSTVDPESLVAKIRKTSWPWYMEMHRVWLSRKAAEKYLSEAGFKKIIFKPHFRFFSLGYAATRLGQIHPLLPKIFVPLGNLLHLNKILVPFYANDLYDCYAFK